jgi:hypothetical protein
MLKEAESFQQDSVTMPRTILAILASLPMLVPPGMCVCKLAPRWFAAAPAATVTPPPATVAIESPSHSCCGCKKHRKARQQKLPHQAAHCACPSCPADPSRTPAERDEHHPGCPKALGVPLVVVQARSGSATLHMLDFLASPLLVPEQVSVGKTAWPDPDGVPILAPPLFLSHCTLLI